MGIYADCYSTYGYAYPGYFSRCNPYYGFNSYYGYGYPYYGYGYPYYGSGGWVIVGGGPTTPVEPTPEGRVINGRGYTQVRRNEPLPSPVAGGSGHSSGGGNSGGNSNSGSSGVTSGGYSSGTAAPADSGARTAVPRPPGN